MNLKFISWTLDSCLRLFHKLKDETKSDPELQQLQKVVMSEWSQTKVETPVETRPYWNYRDEISCYKGLMFKDDCVIVPHSLRPEIPQRIQVGHLGIDKCRARARSAVFFPGIKVLLTSWYLSAVPVSNTSEATRESL